jgi:ribosomal-protein-alanine N-acetyltransferase
MEIQNLNFSLRPVSVDDIDKILEIEKKSYKLPWTKEQFYEELNKPYSRFLVLTDDETDSLIAGYIVYWIMFDEAHILNVTIDTEWRGLGFAKKLVRTVINESLKKNLKRVFLEVRKSNLGAINLYQSLGFYIDHIKPKFYDDGEDALFMVLILEEPQKPLS